MTTLLKDFASVVLFSYQEGTPQAALARLKKCLKSIYKNTLFPFELILFDNGSDPKIQRFLLGELANKRISMLLLNSPEWRRSFSASLNYAWNLSKGNFLIKLDSDCVVEKGWLIDGITAMQAFPEISYWSFMHFSSGGQEEGTLLREIRRGEISIQVHHNSPNKCFMVHRSTWKELGDFPEFDADFDENWFYLAKIVPFARVQQPLTARKRKGYWRGMDSSNKWLALPDASKQKVHLINDREVIQGNQELSRIPIQFSPLLFGDPERSQIPEVPKSEINGTVGGWNEHLRSLPKVKRDRTDAMLRSRFESLKDSS